MSTRNLDANYHLLQLKTARIDEKIREMEKTILEQKWLFKSFLWYLAHIKTGEQKYYGQPVLEPKNFLKLKNCFSNIFCFSKSDINFKLNTFLIKNNIFYQHRKLLFLKMIEPNMKISNSFDKMQNFNMLFKHK